MLLVVTNLNLQHIYILPGKQYIKYMYIHLMFIHRHIQTFDSLDHFVLFWIFKKFFIKCLWSVSSITSQLLFACLHAYKSIDRNFLFYRNRSWPAVSQIWSLTDFPPTFTTLLPNSTPIVWLESFLTENSKKEFKNYWCSSFFFNYTINLVNFVSVLHF